MDQPISVFAEILAAQYEKRSMPATVLATTWACVTHDPLTVAPWTRKVPSSVKTFTLTRGALRK